MNRGNCWLPARGNCGRFQRGPDGRWSWRKAPDKGELTASTSTTPEFPWLAVPEAVLPPGSRLGVGTLTAEDLAEIACRLKAAGYGYHHVVEHQGWSDEVFAGRLRRPCVHEENASADRVNLFAHGTSEAFIAGIRCLLRPRQRKLDFPPTDAIGRGRVDLQALFAYLAHSRQTRLRPTHTSICGNLKIGR